MAPPAPAGSNADGSSAAAVAVACCMCGDLGLTGELFRCGLCLHRLQHRYCSDLYPRVAAYQTCNWCLRDDEGGRGSPVKAPPPMTTTAKQWAPSRLTDSRDHIHGGGDEDRSCGGSGGGCSRSVFPAGSGKAVKKPKKSHEGPAALRSVTTTTTAATRRKPPSRAKARVQRYKLLAEVIISC